MNYAVKLFSRFEELKEKAEIERIPELLNLPKSEFDRLENDRWNQWGEIMRRLMHCKNQFFRTHSFCAIRNKMGLAETCSCPEYNPVIDPSLIYPEKLSCEAALKKIFPRCLIECRCFGEQWEPLFSNQDQIEIPVPQDVLVELEFVHNWKIFDHYTIRAAKELKDFVLLGHRPDAVYLVAYWGLEPRWEKLNEKICYWTLVEGERILRRKAFMRILQNAAVVLGLGLLGTGLGLALAGLTGFGASAPPTVRSPAIKFPIPPLPAAEQRFESEPLKIPEIPKGFRNMTSDY